MNRIFNIEVTGWDADGESVVEDIRVLAASHDEAIDLVSLDDLRYVVEIGEATVTGSALVNTGALAIVTSQLRKGDIVLDHGMQLLLDREVCVSTAHPESPGVGDGKTRFVQALVLNRDDEATSVVPRGWTADWDRSASANAARPHRGEHRWTIQGNDRALWYVQRGVIARAPRATRDDGRGVR